LYVSHISENFVSVINPSTNKVIDTIQAGKGPTCVARKPGSSILYITNYTSNDVTVYDEITGQITGTIVVGDHPCYVSFISNGDFAVISHESNDGIIIVNTTAQNVFKRLEEGIGDIYLCDDGKTMYQPQISTPYVFVIDASTYEIKERIEVGGRPLQLVFSPDEKFAYVTNFDLNEIEKIDTKSGEIVSRIGRIPNPRELI